MDKNPIRRVETLPLTVIISLLSVSAPVTASHESLECNPPPSLEPLFDFIHTIGELAFIAGIGIASIGVLVAAIMFMLPGEDYSRRGRKILKNTLIGAVILLSSNAILGFMTNQLGGSMC